MDPNTLDGAIRVSREQLLSLQRPDGHWRGDLKMNTISESGFILLQAIRGRLEDPRVPSLAKYILSQQNDDGGWTIYPGGPSDLDASIEAYFALKLAGIDHLAHTMALARDRILEMGGAEEAMTFRLVFLAALGQIPYSYCPSIPPELLFAPKWFPINLYRMSSWTRTLLVPLSIILAYKPVTTPADGLSVTEIFRIPPQETRKISWSVLQGSPSTWGNIFLLADQMLKYYERLPFTSMRNAAIRAAERWIIDRSQGSKSPVGYSLGTVYMILALRCLGYSDNCPEVMWLERQLNSLVIEEGDAIRFQPCFSPVWDTAWSMLALAASGVSSDDPVLVRAGDWLLEREIRRPSDWAIYRPHLEPSGWSFQYDGIFYPDLDDTAIVLLAFSRSGRLRNEDFQGGLRRATRFLKGMQSGDGGWAGFEPDINNKFLEQLPFADHNAILDPSCADVTGRVLEMFGQYGHGPEEPFIKDAVKFLFRIQEPEGCWYGRWGVNYIYGTWQALVGLESIGLDQTDPRIRTAVQWIKSVQHTSGGWGESCASYADRSMMGKGDPTPSQTSWAVLSLMAHGEANSPHVRRGIQWLLTAQKTEGDWEEAAFTGTGLPEVIYLRYSHYRIYFPLIALARYRDAVANET
ncbi:squalene--hopene cyclase [Thermodesulfobacteriota bacterium]